MSKKGFTLIELLVVISIIGVLSSVVLASLNSARMKARDARRLSDMHQIQLALAMYYDNNNQYPSDAGYCFNNVNSVITGPTKALAAYLPNVPNDPSPSLYTYCYVGGVAASVGGGTYGIRYTRETKTPPTCYINEGGPLSGWWGVAVCPST